MSKPFTFLIGPDHVEVMVPNNLAKGVSDPLHALMNNGNMIESQEGKATLEDVDLETFCRFCDWVYRRDYSVEKKDVAYEAMESMKLSSTRPKNSHCDVHQTTDCGPTFDCNNCNSLSCRSCPWCGSRYCVAIISNQASTDQLTGSYCPSHDTYGCVLADYLCWGCERCFCGRCPDCASLESEVIVQGETPWTAFKKRNFHTAFLSPEAAKSYDENLRFKDVSVKNNMLPHAQLYASADKCLIDALKALCLDKLHRELVACPINDATVFDFTETVDFTYANTSDLGKCQLRSLVISFAASKAEKLCFYSAFGNLLRRNAEISADFAFCLINRLRSEGHG